MALKTPSATRRKAAQGHPRAIPNRECFRVNLRDALCCHACGRRPSARETYHKGFEYHHVTPVRQGGAGAAENIALLCKACHRLADTGALNLNTDALRVPDAVPCRACGADFDPRTVEMNCAWYECPNCAERTHLYDHFKNQG